jgi:2-polyprenyl-6-methoxyphenol hydroxylase-like FAD-dependent oxidoreductase
MLDYRGLLDRLRQEATFAGPVPRFSFGPLQLDFSRLGTSPVHILTVPQRRLEEVLEARLTELGGTVRRGLELTALSPHDDAVSLDVRGPGGDYRLRARYLAGCDGAHSLVRKQAGIGFPGTTSPEISRIGQVRLPTAKLTRRGGVVKVPGIGRLKLMGQVRTPRGTHSLAPLTVLDKNAPAGVFIVHTSEDDPTADLSAPMTLEELRASARRVLGGDLPMTDPQRLSRLVGNSRQADRYQAGRILLAGDAAHVFAVSLNTGLIDAVNLGWKLAAQVQGRAPDGLLESYHAERHLAGQHAILLGDRADPEHLRLEHGPAFPDLLPASHDARIGNSVPLSAGQFTVRAQRLFGRYGRLRFGVADTLCYRPWCVAAAARRMSTDTSQNARDPGRDE